MGQQGLCTTATKPTRVRAHAGQREATAVRSPHTATGAAPAYRNYKVHDEDLEQPKVNIYKTMKNKNESKCPTEWKDRKLYSSHQIFIHSFKHLLFHVVQVVEVTIYYY